VLLFTPRTCLRGHRRGQRTKDSHIFLFYFVFLSARGEAHVSARFFLGKAEKRLLAGKRLADHPNPPPIVSGPYQTLWGWEVGGGGQPAAFFQPAAFPSSEAGPLPHEASLRKALAPPLSHGAAPTMPWNRPSFSSATHRNSRCLVSALRPPGLFGFINRRRTLRTTHFALISLPN